MTKHFMAIVVVFAIALAVARQSLAQPPANPVVGFYGNGAILANGDTYGPESAFCDFCTYHFLNNVFVTAGHQSADPIAAIAGGRAVTAGGDVYDQETGGCYPCNWHYSNNVFQSAGRTSSGTVVATAGAVVMTSDGDIYQQGCCSPTWVYKGNIFSGPTAATRTSWGAMKSRYRMEGTAKQAQDR
ncbi:MAG TPA: hypothetical protein VGK89_09795 [Candidatus Eisenbacteria bacterium]|jgi:hypothetical protein